MSLLDRKQLFIEVVRSRKEIHKAKVTLLRKLIRKTTLLRKKQNTAAVAAKNSMKADRILAEIHELKNIDVDAAVKFIFCTSISTCLKNIEDVEAAVILKVTSRLAMERNMKKRVEELAAKYSNWNSSVEQLLQPKTAKKKKVLVKKKQNVNGDKGSNDNGSELEFDGKDSDTQSASDDEKEMSHDAATELEKSDTSDSFQNNHEERPIKKESTNKKIQAADNKQLKNKLKSTDKKLHKLSNDLVTTSTELKTSNDSVKTSAEVEATKVAGIAVVRKITNLQELENLEKQSSAPVFQEDVKKKSSFFLSDDGNEVESEEELDDSESEESDEEKDQQFSRVYHSRGNQKDRSHLGNLKQSTPSQNSKTTFRKKQILATRFEQKLESHQRNKKENKLHPQKITSEKLHPSWEAKKKMKEAININLSHQNKKIKFDD